MKATILLFTILIAYSQGNAAEHNFSFPAHDAHHVNDLPSGTEFSLLQEEEPEEEESTDEDENVEFRAYRENESRFSAGSSFFRGVGGYRYSLPTLGFLGFGYSRRGIPIPIYFSLENGLTDQISVGAIAGYYSNGYRFRSGYFWPDGPYDKTGEMWRYTLLGGSSTFHPRPYLDELADEGLIPAIPEEIDFYGTLALAGIFQSHTIEANNRPDNTERSFGLGLGITIGARYYLTEEFAVYLETGRGLFGMSGIGLTYRFN